jgi:hypothetical protein
MAPIHHIRRTVFDARAEHAAEHFAATNLISAVDYPLAEDIHGPNPDAIGHERGVDIHLLKVWQTMTEKITS